MRRPPIDVRPTRQPRGPRQSRIGLVAVVVVLFFVLTSLRGIASFYTDFLWFDEVGFADVWRGVLGAKVGLSVVFTLGFFLLLWVNLVLADRVAPKFRPTGPEDEIVARYQEVIGPFAGKVRFGVAALFALIAGTGMGGQWQNWILFRNSVPFGLDDALFKRDISFFVFRLPFLADVVNWLFVALVLSLVMTVVAHYLNGGIRVQAPISRTTPQVKAHVSVLLGLLALVKAADYFFRQFELTFSRRGFVEGASYTDVNASLPALRLLTLIMAAAFLLFIINIWRRGWALPVIAILVWGVVAVAAGGIYPAVVQTFKVKPAENSKERPYIARNIAATRAALNIGGVEATPFAYDNKLDGADLQGDAETIRNIRLWDPDTLVDTYRKLQESKSYYQFADVDIDRYQVDGATRQVVLSVRGLDPSQIPGNSWVNEHLQYTHGYGAVLSSANAVNAQGRPDFLVSDLPPRGKPELEEPRIYFSENLGGYSIVNSKQPEIDYQTPEGKNITSQYKGDGGIALMSRVRRLAFALRFADQNLLVSSQVSDTSRIIFNRDVKARVRAAAPFLAYDSDPYPVVVGGRVIWVLDAYTTTDRYPYAQNAETSGLRSGSDLLGRRFNYVRNSVKATIDAYTGETTFYVIDSTDPMAKAYAKAFPSLFTDGDEMAPELRAHLRYPEDLFRVQANMFGEYHVTDADAFYSGTDKWDIAQDPGTGRVSAQLRTTATTVTGGGVGSAGLAPSKLQRIEPTYLLLRLPGEERIGFTILQPFVFSSSDDRQINLTAFLTAKSDGADYGKLKAFVLPRGQQVDGPLVVNNAIQSEPDISRELSLLDGRGSSAHLGQVQLVPIGTSLLYVRPLYVTSEATNLPEVKRVIVVYEGRAVMKPTLQEALSVMFGSAPETLEEGVGGTAGPGAGGGAGGTTAAPTVADLLTKAQAAFEAAETALRSGDLATYQAKNKEGADLTTKAAKALAASSAEGGTTTTSAPPTTSTTEQPASA
ncbi:MAG TPA: UPF0182 family protein [Acidimicrobiales bacterium]|nr:UPF0182 family protein [Acidimicrobiales bacterium]